MIIPVLDIYPETLYPPFSDHPLLTGEMGFGQNHGKFPYAAYGGEP